MSLREKWRGRTRHGLLENTIMLYILQFSTMALGFFTQGFQTRVLGMEKVGALGAAAYATNFFQMFIDFGFILSATAKISQHREDRAYLSRVLTCVVAAKSLFMVLSFGVLLAFIAPSLTGEGELMVYVFYLLSVCMGSFLPDFMYRGLEQMSAVTVRAVSIKIFATIMIFLFIREPADYYKVPLFTALGNGGALAFVYWHLFTRVKVGFTKVRPGEIWAEVKESSQFFLSKVAGSVNSSLNGVLLKAVAGDAVTGLYTNADKVITVARSGMSPIADSLYPHMMKNRNFSIVKKALLFVYPVILAGCAVVFIFAEPLLVLWLGPEGRGVAPPLRMLMPVAVFCFPNYVLGYPTLGAMGLTKYANISVVFGTAVFLLGIAAAWLTHSIGLLALCMLSSVTEFSILAFRVAVILRNRKKFRSSPRQPEK